MIRSLAKPALFAAAVAVSAAVWAADGPTAPPVVMAAPSAPAAGSESRSFIQSYLAPKMSARLGNSRAAVHSEFASPNPWTSRIEDTEDQVRRGAIKATKSALKKYALERLNLTGWSVPLRSGQAKGVQAFRTESGGPRLRLGFSHRAPNAEAVIPLDRGRLSFSASLLGRVGTSFETPGGKLRVGAYFDPQEDAATAAVSFAF